LPVAVALDGVPVVARGEEAVSRADFETFKQQTTDSLQSERHAPEPAVITAMGQNLNIRVFTGIIPSIELLVQLLSTSK
jgi:hypothetical protein